MLRSLLIFVVAVICLAMPCIIRAGEPDAAEQTYRRRLDMLREHSAEIQKSLQLARAEKNEIQQSIRETTGLVEVDPETVHRLITTLQEQHEQLELDAAGADGRRAALQEAVAQLSRQLDEHAASDQVSIELAKVAEIRQIELKRLMEANSKGMASQADVETAQAALATARAEVAAARQKAVSSASGDALDAWNRELLELTIAAQERAARLRFVTGRLEKLSGALHALDVAESTRADVPRLEKEALEAEDRIRALAAERDIPERQGDIRYEQPATTQPAARDQSNR